MSTSDVERVVVDVDELGGVDGLRAGLGDHDRDRLADEAHLVGGQHRAAHLLRRVDRRAGGGERLQVRDPRRCRRRPRRASAAASDVSIAVDRRVGEARSARTRRTARRARAGRRCTAACRAGRADPRPAAPMPRDPHPLRSMPSSVLRSADQAANVNAAAQATPPHAAPSAHDRAIRRRSSGSPGRSPRARTRPGGRARSTPVAGLDVGLQAVQAERDERLAQHELERLGHVALARVGRRRRRSRGRRPGARRGRSRTR